MGENKQSVVDSILSAVSSNDENQFKSIEVDAKELIELDEGNLLAVNENKIDPKEFKQNTEETLLQNAREATQCLFNSLWQLPLEQVQGTFVIKLPEPKTWLPREKPVPKKKAMTKWEEYAKTKGILNRKKSRMIWDEASQEYKPRWGYKRANDETKEWCIEVPDNADPMEDQFAKRKDAKKERVAKNELQRLRNIARGQKGSKKVPGVGLTPTERPSKDYLSKALAVAHKSTASIGKFTDRLPKEKPSKFTGKKRKFEPSIGNLSSEKARQLSIIETNAKKAPKIDITKATNRAIRQEEEQASRKKQNQKTPKKAKGKKAAALGGKKSSGGPRKGGGNKKTRGKRKA